MSNTNETVKIKGLTLCRKTGESIVIGGDVLVHVSEIRGDKVRLTIDAPKDVSIHRREVWLRVNSK